MTTDDGTTTPERRERARPGEARAMFERLVVLETDECVVWPYGTSPGGHGVLHVGGKSRWCHRLALERHVGPRPPGMFALHGPCHNPRCMNYRHLRWGTLSENALDRVRDGTDCRGERVWSARLNEHQVRQIRALAMEGWGRRALGRRYGVSHTQIRLVFSMQMMRPPANARCVVHIFKVALLVAGGDAELAYGQWNTFETGAHEPFLHDARIAAQQAGVAV